MSKVRIASPEGHLVDATFSPSGAARLASDTLALIRRSHLAGRTCWSGRTRRSTPTPWSPPRSRPVLRCRSPCGWTADQTHRRHAIVENVHADLKASALAHLPSGVFTADAARLVCAVMAFHLTHAAATLTRAAALAKATIATIRRKLVTVPARIATSARRLHLHLPSGWPWQAAWSALYDALFTRPVAAVT